MTTKNTKSVNQPSTDRKQAVSKTAVAFWKDRVRLERGRAHYGVNIEYQKRRRYFGLETSDKGSAAIKARDIFVLIVGQGWDAALATLRPEAVKPKKSATVGALIEAATRLSSARAETLHEYAKALRRLAAGALAHKSKGKRTPSRMDDDRSTVDATPMDKLTPAAVLAFKNKLLKSATTPQERDSRAVTFNSLMRNSKALLSKRVRPHIEKELNLPSQLWFEGVLLEKQPPMRYKSRIDAGAILSTAQAELADKQPEVFKALMMTLALGLRRSEADNLMWRQFDFKSGTLELMDTEAQTLKSRDSAGILGLDDELKSLFMQFHATRKSEWVLETPPHARATTRKGRAYRCHRWFNELVDWLRGQGVVEKKPIHTMRKEIGSVIASRDGIFAASRYLRHSTIQVTSMFYADLKKPVSAGLGAFLTPPPEPKNVIEGAFNSSPATAEKPAKPIKTGKARA
jgi:integrase